MNIYTCSKADIQSFQGIGDATASKLIKTGNQVLAGTRQPLTIAALREIRAIEWQILIDEGQLNIEVQAMGKLPEFEDRQFITAAELDSRLVSLETKFSFMLNNFSTPVILKTRRISKKTC